MSEFKETIMILENKVEHAEAELIKHFKETKDLKNIYNREKEESSVLKGVIKNHQGEMFKIGEEIKI